MTTQEELTAVSEQLDAILLKLGETQERMFDAQMQHYRLLETQERVIELLKDGLQTDGSHHKQWYLGEVLKLMNAETHGTHDKGIAP